MNDKEFITYVLEFYGHSGMCADFFTKPVTHARVKKALARYKKMPGTDYAGDSFDREKVRDLMLIEEGHLDTEWFKIGPNTTVRNS